MGSNVLHLLVLVATNLGQVQGQDQGQGQGQDHLLLQRAALPQLYLVLALTLVLTLDLAQITKPPSAKYTSVYNDNFILT